MEAISGRGTSNTDQGPSGNARYCNAQYSRRVSSRTRALDLTEVGQNAHTMAQQIINNGLKGSLHEIWGSEVTVYYPGLYAGATDVVGVYEGYQSIVDFKQTNKPKRREWIEDYFLQLAAYAMAHNHVYGTQITQGCILMCSKDNYFQRFIVNGNEFKQYKHKWLRRVDEYYNQKSVK